MNLATIAGVVVSLTLIVGMVLAFLIERFSHTVVIQNAETEQEKRAYNLALTKGYKIPVAEPAETQVKQARIVAAQKAATLPRGANMRIQGQSEDIQTAFKGVDEDPITAAKIAAFHTWQGVLTGTHVAQAQVVTTNSQTVIQTRSAKDLKPGVDYPIIKITDDMDPAEKRKARIANSKAKSAAIKALKESGGASAQSVPTPVTAPSSDSVVMAVSSSAQSSSGVQRALVAGVDYPVIEITDDMDPAEKRKARIANSKAKSAAAKALKASGALETIAESSSVSAPVETIPSPSPVAEPIVSADVPAPPEYIEITEDMDPAEMRKARIANSKMRSAYNKELKAAGIDPQSLK